jgi:hypothetical protein
MNELFEQYPEALKMHGYDDCAIGVCHRINQPTILAYSYDKLIARHIKDGMTNDEAVEWIDFNQLGAWVGEHTPCIVELYE